MKKINVDKVNDILHAFKIKSLKELDNKKVLLVCDSKITLIRTRGILLGAEDVIRIVYCLQENSPFMYEKHYSLMHLKYSVTGKVRQIDDDKKSFTLRFSENGWSRELKLHFDSSSHDLLRKAFFEEQDIRIDLDCENYYEIVTINEITVIKKKENS